MSHSISIIKYVGHRYDTSKRHLIIDFVVKDPYPHIPLYAGKDFYFEFHVDRVTPEDLKLMADIRDEGKRFVPGAFLLGNVVHDPLGWDKYCPFCYRDVKYYPDDTCGLDTIPSYALNNVLKKKVLATWLWIQLKAHL